MFDAVFSYKATVLFKHQTHQNSCVPWCCCEKKNVRFQSDMFSKGGKKHFAIKSKPCAVIKLTCYYFRLFLNDAKETIVRPLYRKILQVAKQHVCAIKKYTVVPLFLNASKLVQFITRASFFIRFSSALYRFKQYWIEVSGVCQHLFFSTLGLLCICVLIYFVYFCFYSILAVWFMLDMPVNYEQKSRWK